MSRRVQQAAYHARASLILNSRDAAAHQFQIVNTGFELSNFGVFYRLAYGNSNDLQTFKPWYVPKPSYFALIEAQRFLAAWKFVSSIPLSGRSLDDQRAFVYRHADGRLAVAMWRTVEGERTYRMPAEWQGSQVRDIFDIAADASAGLRLGALPLVVYLPGRPQAGSARRSIAPPGSRRQFIPSGPRSRTFRTRQPRASPLSSHGEKLRPLPAAVN